MHTHYTVQYWKKLVQMPKNIYLKVYYLEYKGNYYSK